MPQLNLKRLWQMIFFLQMYHAQILYAVYHTFTDRVVLDNLVLGSSQEQTQDKAHGLILTLLNAFCFVSTNCFSLYTNLKAYLWPFLIISESSLFLAN